MDITDYNKNFMAYDAEKGCNCGGTCLSCADKQHSNYGGCGCGESSNYSGCGCEGDHSNYGGEYSNFSIRNAEGHAPDPVKPDLPPAEKIEPKSERMMLVKGNKKIITIIAVAGLGYLAWKYYGKK